MVPTFPHLAYMVPSSSCPNPSVLLPVGSCKAAEFCSGCRAQCAICRNFAKVPAGWVSMLEFVASRSNAFRGMLKTLQVSSSSSSLQFSAMSMAGGKPAIPMKKLLIEKKLTEGLAPVLLEVEDVSHQHAGHAGAPKGSSETHFNVTVVSEQFLGRSLLKRHRLVYDFLHDELQHGGVHALSLNTKTPAEVAPKP